MADVLSSALHSIPADDRETWIRMGMAIKDELGESGFGLWDAWSRRSDKYNAHDAQFAWRSFKPRPDGVTVASLFHEARGYGWSGEAPVKPPISSEEKRRRAELTRMGEKKRRERERLAVKASQWLIDTAVYDHHEYLTNKGFPDQKGLIATIDYPDHRPQVDAGDLLIPMRHFKTNRVQSIQAISTGGHKRFLAGGRAGGAVHRIGRGFARWYCEGYATGLSVQAALARLFRRDQVVVCFSAHSLPQAAAHDSWPEGYVVADQDHHSCPKCKQRWDGAWEERSCPSCGNTKITLPAGEKYARESGLPYWMPPEPGTDANDYHQKHSVKALADALRGVMHESR